MAFGKKTTAAAAPKKGGFKYQPRTADQYKDRASQQGGGYDQPTHDKYKTFNPKAGDHDIRILPPTWEDAESFGLETWLHYGIGADQGTYVCAAKMKGDECVLCDARVKAEREGEEELAGALKPGKRIALWIIDRSAEKEGPKLWLAPWTVERDICTLAVDKKTGEVYQLDDPEAGYDVSFTVVGEKLTKKYTGTQIARRASALHDDEDKANEWLQYISDNPLPDVLIYRDAEYLEQQLNGGVRIDDKKDAKGKEKGDKLNKEQEAALRKVEEKGSRPKLGRKPAPEPEPEPEAEGDTSELPTWDELHEMSEDDLLELCEAVQLDPANCPEDVEPADWVCEQLEIAAPKPEPAPAAKPSFKDRLAKLKGKK
jgi:hypothetical protein